MEMAEEDEFEDDLNSKTMGSEKFGVLKLDSGELVERSHIELSMGELIEEYRSHKRITLIQLINRITEAKYRFHDYEFKLVVPVAEDIIEMFKKNEDGGVNLKNEIQSQQSQLSDNINAYMMNACEELAELFIENRNLCQQLANPIDAYNRAIDLYSIIIDKI